LTTSVFEGKWEFALAERSIDRAALFLLKKAAREGVETAWDRFEKQQPQCGFGQLGICCRNCNMGPCRIDPFGDGPQEGVCGTTADTIAARNLLRMIAAGAAAHSDHGRDIITTVYAAACGEAQGYEIKDEEIILPLTPDIIMEIKKEAEGGRTNLIPAIRKL